MSDEQQQQQNESNRPAFGQFGGGDKPIIAVINKASVPLSGEVAKGGGYDLDRLIAAMQIYIDQFITPHWATPATLQKATDFIKGAWALVFIDDADVAGALAYHDLTPDGWPLSKVFVKTTTSIGEQVSVSATHELVEMLVDPAINMMSTGPTGSRLTYAYESADPVEDLSFLINDIPMSDFVYPSFFEAFRPPNSTKFDHMGKITKPFQILPGGYQIVYDGRRWKNIFGSTEKEEAIKKEDRRGHRSELRKEKWKRQIAV